MTVTPIPSRDNEPIRAAVRTTVEPVDPKRAQAWLDQKNQINRTLRDAVVLRYAEQMAAGQFPNTGEPIIFDWNDQLVSGQHRLQALVLADVMLSFVIVRGVDPSVRDVVDTGVKRTLADTLKLHGEINQHSLASTLGWLWRYQSGRMRWAHLRPSNTAALALLAEHPGLRDTVKTGGRIRRAVGGPVGVYAAMWHLMADVDRDAATEYVEQIIQGTLLEPGDPAYAFRRAMSYSKPNHRLEPQYVAALFIKAWNMFRSGRQIQTLVWKPAVGEPFPEVK